MEFLPVDSSNPNHIQFLYDLLAERPEYANISHRAMPTFAEHLEFVKRNPYAEWYVVLAPMGEPMGSVYFTYQNEIGIFLSHKWQGRGIGKQVLAKAESMAPDRRVLANIAPGNDRSIAMFEKAGYRLIQHTYEKVVI